MPEEAINAEVPADAGTPPETPETPATGAPPEAPSDSPDTDWKQRAEVAEKRYEDLRPQANQWESALADIEGRNGPERQRQALAERARVELEDEEAEEEPDEFDLPPDPNDRLDALEQREAEREQQHEQDEFDRLEAKYLEDTVGALEGKEGIKLTEGQYGFVINNALANRDPHDGKPDVEGSFSAFKAEVEAGAQKWVKSKETVVPPNGTKGELKITPEMLRDKDTRQKIAVEAYEAAERAQES